MHKVFISYHHRNDQAYKERLIEMNEAHKIFIDMSVDTGDIDDDLPPQTIRTTIRDEYLRESTVTILLVGNETRHRKHVDWEIYSSMYNGAKNKRSGILVIQLDYLNNENVTAALPEEKAALYPQVTNWYNLGSAEEYRSNYPDLPERIIDNLINPDVALSVVGWSTIANNPAALGFLIEATAKARLTNEYDLSRDMRMRDHDPGLNWI